MYEALSFATEDPLTLCWGASVYLLYSYKSTNSDGGWGQRYGVRIETAAGGGRVTCASISSDGEWIALGLPSRLVSVTPTSLSALDLSSVSALELLVYQPLSR